MSKRDCLLNFLWILYLNSYFRCCYFLFSRLNKYIIVFIVFLSNSSRKGRKKNSKVSGGGRIRILGERGVEREAEKGGRG
jgi:hypothetical protein